MKKSAAGKYWSPHIHDEILISDLGRSLKLSDFLARIVSNRVSSVDDAENYLNPKLKAQLPDPFHLRDMEKAIERTIAAIKADEKIEPTIQISTQCH